MEFASVLMVLTSVGMLNNSFPTGYWMSESAHPWFIFKHEQKWDVTFASPQGGVVPVDKLSEKQCIDEMCDLYKNDKNVQQQLSNTIKLSDVIPDIYDIVFFVGGHGTMVDFPNNPDISRIINEIYPKSTYCKPKIISAVCHGPSALFTIKINDQYLLNNKKVTGFSDAEERAAGTYPKVPYSQQEKILDANAYYNRGQIFTPNMVIDGILVTGQNPQSSIVTARGVLTAIDTQLSMCNRYIPVNYGPGWFITIMILLGFVIGVLLTHIVIRLKKKKNATDYTELSTN